MWDDIRRKIDAVANTTYAQTFFCPANANVVCAIINNSHDRIVIVTQNFGAAYKDWIQVFLNNLYFFGNFHILWLKSQWTNNDARE